MEQIFSMIGMEPDTKDNDILDKTLAVHWLPSRGISDFRKPLLLLNKHSSRKRRLMPS